MCELSLEFTGRKSHRRDCNREEEETGKAKGIAMTLTVYKEDVITLGLSMSAHVNTW